MIRTRRPRAAAPALAAGMLLLLGACGEPGSATGDPTGATPTDDGGPVTASCEPVPGDELVVLADDQNLQTVDNIIPAVNADVAAADAGLVPLLDTVSAALDTEKLIALNKAVDVERRTSVDVAAEFVADEGLAADDDAAGAGTTIAVGAADFAESATLGNIYAEVLRSAGYEVTVTTVGNREAYLPALRAGDQIQVVPEYVGTLAEFVNRSVNGADAEPVASGNLDETVVALTALGTEAGLVFGTPSAAQNQNAFAVTQAFADEHNLSTLSDLAAVCQGLVLGAGPECTERPFCQPGLEDVYGLTFSQFRSLDAGGPLTKEALRQGEITLGLVFSSDGALG
ncbi:Substrate-binding region of ABC-type glycine betaine transport system [Xylanimonas cellulosilytica DSM 15894]|uniref:Substrate-binding region of ABC-type glycine betaine transport system n=1 Tax=Xylanimonas cellulosilytica (strain DSM 15894 / JCM 12276 / CECT 5975 / KCTC 9989 / LMG 20990 / NBRC 107835 / XIL07) TaxID=446471 RepID=D1BZF5_XYLCX|nr:glycine betaine ABC transporter substrate-binding protein [Xylanimonas cellulosilytica]ACZ30109.1 Substrate-binding region of ABC-type glycine betaine transport system [Xylanimonas cellulosilytica DSM 15894]